MLYTSLFALAAALSATAAPLVEVSNLEGPNTFSIPTVKKPNHVKNGAAAYRRALAKYGVDVSQFGKRQDGTVSATPDNGDLEYTCPVQLGSAGTTLNLDFDTGSADLWVFSSLMPSSEKSGHNIYPVSSGTKKSGYTWDISYGDGSSASGSVYTDVVKIGGTTVKNQAVEAAKKAASSFVSSDNDGLVGLAWSSINTVSPTPQKTFFDNAKSGLKSPLFAADLKHDKAGSYDFGYIDSSKYTGSIGYASVDNSDGFWKVATQSYAVGSATAKSYKGPGIADTGTTLLLMADSVVSAYYAKISGAENSSSEGGYVFPCSATVPSFTLTIAGVSIVIPASYMNYAPVSDGSSTCFGALQSNSGIGFDIYGDIFLKSAYVVFDAGNVRLGVAKKSTS